MNRVAECTPSHAGFLPNVRQQRAAGCAALELAQTVLKDLEARKNGTRLFVSSRGSSGGKGKDGTHRFHWRDAMDIIVKWRQLSEPNDQVTRSLSHIREESSGVGCLGGFADARGICFRIWIAHSDVQWPDEVRAVLHELRKGLQETQGSAADVWPCVQF